MSTKGARDDAGDADYDEWLDALADGDGFYLACPEGHGSLPPRWTCPHCGATELAERPLPGAGSVDTYTVVHVAGPRFADDAPYVTAVVSFDPVRLTGVLRGVAPDDAAVGMRVAAGVEESRTTGDRVVTFRPR